MINREKLEEEIRQVAFELYVKSGCIPGRDLDNWLEAENIVMIKYGLKSGQEEGQTAGEEDKPKKRGRGVCKKSTATKKGKGRGKKS
jgi:hypothetical protein